MKLQLALDDISLQEAIGLVGNIQDYVDIIEVGTPFMMENGLKAVETLKKAFPQKIVLCDAKIMDAGAYEAKLAFDCLADIVTVLGVTDVRTVEDCVKEANSRGKKVMVDMICVKDLAAKIPEVEGVGAHIVAVHTGVDQQAMGRTPLMDLAEMKKHVKTAQVAVAGGINSQTAGAYIELKPDIIIVGGGIKNASDPLAEAKSIAEQIQ